MRQSPALVLLGSLALACGAAADGPQPPDSYQGEALEVKDGDNVVVRVALGLDVERILNVRVLGIDTPELKPPAKACPGHSAASAKAYERNLAVLAKAQVEALVRGAVLRLSAVKPDKYGGRHNAAVEVRDGARWRDLGALLVARGLAKPFDGQSAKAPWCPPAGWEAPPVGVYPADPDDAP